MEKQKKTNRSLWLHVRLTPEEHTRLHKHFNATTEARISEYVRKVILAKPMITAVRNQSLQDILSELLRLRKDLNGAANNFNQVVKKLHSLTPENNIQQWLLTFRLDEKKLLSAIEDIRLYIQKTSAKWLQE